MRNGWQTKTLGEVLQKGETVNPRQSPEDEFDYIDVSSVSNETFRIEQTQRLKGKDAPSRARRLVKANDVLFATVRPTLQRIAVVPDEFDGQVCSTGYFVLRPKPELDHRFVFYSLLTEDFLERMEALQTGASYPAVNDGQVRAQPLSYPEVPEQRRIVGILDEAFAGIATAKAHAEQNLQNANVLFQSVLAAAAVGAITKEWRSKHRNGKADAEFDLAEVLRRIEETTRKTSRREETVGHEAIKSAIPRAWCVTSIDGIFNLIDYRGKTPVQSKTGRRLITAKNIRMGFLSDEPLTFISEDAYRKWMVRGFPKPGDIFFVTEGHTMGFVARNTRTDAFALAQRTITLQPAVPFDTKFFFYFMMSRHFQDLVKLNATGAAAVGMKGSKFRTLPLAFPPVAEQRAIVGILDELSSETQRLESIYQRKLAALDELKKSLLHQAFNGKL